MWSKLLRASLTVLLFLFTLLYPIHDLWGMPCACGEYNRVLYETTPPLKGEDVRELQNRLQQLGFYTGRCDGVYDSTTATAVRDFQKSRKQLATGRVDHITWKQLGEGCEHRATTDSPTTPRNVSILVDLEKLTLTVFDGERPVREYPVAAGKPSTPSPVGEWKIIDKSSDWGGAFGVRWMGLNVPWGNYGIHGTNNPWSIGTAASAGCIRMFNEDVIQVYEWAPVGTRVKIQAPLSWLAGSRYRILEEGDCGRDVVYAQLLLREAGFNPYYCDGWYGNLTKLAVKCYQLHAGLPITGKIDEKTFEDLERRAGLLETEDQ